ncbi:hypothetical protein FQN50_006120 [Emmonsiellopsis sp. PD_5]|nr:hypothetical protein FQN50_006120 [Emmonsiellopsis sp. PD_5]
MSQTKTITSPARRSAPPWPALRRPSVSSSTDTLASINISTPPTPSTKLDPRLTDLLRPLKPTVPINLNVFYGYPNINVPRLQHITFRASIHEEFFTYCQRSTAAGQKGREERRQQRFQAELPQFGELAYLAAAFNETLLGLCEGACVGCGRAGEVKGMVYRPLCCGGGEGVYGFEGLRDEVGMRRLMMVVGNLVEEFDSDEMVMRAIGVVDWDTFGKGAAGGDENTVISEEEEEVIAFVNMLAVPVCDPDSECQYIVERVINTFMQGILKGLEIGEKRSSARLSTQSIPKETLDIGWQDILGDTASEDEVESNAEEESTPIPPKPRPLSMDDMLPIRLAVYCGAPIVDPTEIPHPDRLSLFLFTSTWPVEVLVSHKPDHRDYTNYQRISALHEKAILDTANFRCATCPYPTKATVLFHRPISFKRDNSTGNCAKAIRDITMKLIQYVGGEWKYPETMALLGLDGICHINDFAVPICQKNSVCEETARIASQAFLHMNLPEGVKPLYQNLYPHSDFSSMCSKNSVGRNAKLLVKKLGKGMMSDSFYEEEPLASIPETEPLSLLAESPRSSNYCPNTATSGGGIDTQMTIAHLRHAIEKGTSWDDLTALFHDRTNISLDFRPVLTSNATDHSSANDPTPTCGIIVPNPPTTTTNNNSNPLTLNPNDAITNDDNDTETETSTSQTPTSPTHPPTPSPSIEPPRKTQWFTIRPPQTDPAADDDDTDGTDTDTDGAIAIYNGHPVAEMTVCLMQRGVYRMSVDVPVLTMELMRVVWGVNGCGCDGWEGVGVVEGGGDGECFKHGGRVRMLGDGEYMGLVEVEGGLL